MALFFWFALNEQFKHTVKHDPDMNAMLGWLYFPFLHGKEYWFALEVLRTLILTSMVGFLADR